MAKLVLILSGGVALVTTILAIHHQVVNPQHISTNLLVSFDVITIIVTILSLLSSAFVPYLLLRTLPGVLLPKSNIAESAPWLSQIQMWLFIIASICVSILTYPQGPTHYQLWHFYSSRDMLKSALVSGLEATLFIWLTAFSCFLCFAVCMVVEQWATKQRTPDLYIINNLRKLLYEVEEQKHLWTDFSAKKDIMSMIEETAICLETYLPLQLKSNDPNTDYKIKQATSERASYLRSMKMWVATPMPDTRQNFAISVAKNLMNATRGDWDSFDKLPPGDRVTQGWLSRLLKFSRAFIVACLPAIVLWLVERPPLHLTMPSYTNVAVLVWAIVTLLIEIDPGFAAKAEALKSVKELFSAGKEK